MPKQSNNTTKPILLALLCFVIGLVLGLCIKNWPFTVDKKIDIADIASILLSGLALYIGYYISSQLDRNKKKEDYEINYVFNKLDGLKRSTLDIFKVVSSREASLSLIDAKIKSLNIEYQDYRASLQICNLQISEDEHKELKDILIGVKRLCTQQPRKTEDDSAIAYTDELELKIEDDKYMYSQTRIEEIDRKLKVLNNKLFEFTMNQK